MDMDQDLYIKRVHEECILDPGNPAWYAVMLHKLSYLLYAILIANIKWDASQASGSRNQPTGTGLCENSILCVASRKSNSTLKHHFITPLYTLVIRLPNRNFIILFHICLDILTMHLISTECNEFSNSSSQTFRRYQQAKSA